MAKRSGKQWRDLTARQRGAIRLLAIVQITLLVVALVELRRRTPEEINGSKRVWMGVIFINVLGPIAYFMFGRKRAVAR